MRALVTGGAGLIGSHLVDLLLGEGWDVRVLDNLEPQTHPNGAPDWLNHAAAEYRIADVRHAASVESTMRGVDVVFHQAAFGGFTNEVRKYGDVNVGGTAAVLDAARLVGVSKVVVASSQAVYGPGYVRCPDGYTVARRTREQAAAGEWEPRCATCGAVTVTEPVVETQHLLPESPYALSKHHAELLAFSVGKQWGLPVVALRYALTYGPRQSVSNPYTGICSIFATRLTNGLPPVVYEDGLQTRDFTYVDDVARANLLVAETAEADGRVFNVGTGVATPVAVFAREVALALEDAGVSFGLERAETPGRWRPHDVRHLVTDASALRALGWEPRVNVAEGLRRYARWFLSQPAPREVFAEGEAALVAAGIVT